MHEGEGRAETRGAEEETQLLAVQAGSTQVGRPGQKLSNTQPQCHESVKAKKNVSSDFCKLQLAKLP